MTQTLAVLSAVLALAVGANAQQTANPEPYSIKTDKLGETAAEWLASDAAHKDWKCTGIDHVADGNNVTCSWEHSFVASTQIVPTYAGIDELSQSASFVATSGKIILYRVQIKLVNGGLHTDTHPDSIVTALNAKFGTPTHHVTPLQNGFGASATEDTWTWTNGTSTVTLDYTTPEPPYQSPVVTFTLDAPARAIQEQKDKEAQKKARSDM